MESKHTKGNAYIETAYNKIYISVDDWQLCEVGSIGPQNTANAERIKVVWNAHDELVKSLEKLITEYEYALGLIAETCGMTYSENDFVITNKQLLKKVTDTPIENEKEQL